MKQKDLIYLVIAVAILLGAGYLAYTQVIAPKSKTVNKETTVEVVGEITTEFNASALSELKDSTKNIDYTVEIDINSGVGNAAVFGK